MRSTRPPRSRVCTPSTEEERGLAGGVVDVHIVIDYGANIPAVAAEVQKRVADYLQKMADVRPTAVNVVVDDVARP